MCGSPVWCRACAEGGIVRAGMPPDPRNLHPRRRPNDHRKTPKNASMNENARSPKGRLTFWRFAWKNVVLSCFVWRWSALGEKYFWCASGDMQDCALLHAWDGKSLIKGSKGTSMLSYWFVPFAQLMPCRVESRCAVTHTWFIQTWCIPQQCIVLCCITV